MTELDLTMRNVRYDRFDAHAHVSGPKSGYVDVMNALSFRGVLNIAWSDLREPDAIAAYEAELRRGTEAYPGRFLFCPTFNVTQYADPSYTDRVTAKLARDIDEHGAVAVKVWKDLGMMLTDPQGNYVFCDDPHFTPIFDFLTERQVVVCMHIGDPKAGWLPLEPGTPHYGYFSQHPEFHWHGRDDRPSHDAIMHHRDNLVGRYPDTTFVCAHLASLAYDIDRVAAFLDAFPNAYVDSAARQGDLAAQPDEKVRAFFERYPDRILYGKDWVVEGAFLDVGEPERSARAQHAVRAYQREFAYYEEHLGLSSDVLEKFYYGNAARLFG
ncbi:MAG: amidohydrolase family protein, partial [Candidatus Hydrogenedentes bacterium]|nr:amidohydrolase family protein [Candidatus Hydrogenedentota bacterium]